ncbi:ABC transporter [Hornefia porci]|uniref:ABC transporter n=1 Tax=Hornefia porci TaxID=2652292 RepID=A0A1Q9JFN4_9FIRM|nr:ABC transporter ATP-binding protein [Hornefia porci]OLR54911.1 ABC transporter [Hornefia porci]
MEVMKLENLSFSYGEHSILKGISCTFDAGKIYAIVGKSGAGKTTLLSLMSGLAEPTEGTIFCNGKEMKLEDKYEYRSRSIGVIFQDFNLLTKLTAVENVELSMEISAENSHKKIDRQANRDSAYGLLAEMGLRRDEADRRILKLSGGQQQRVAIARALSYGPDIILADEPTGNLDEETQREIMGIFRDLAKNGKCVIIVTHSSYVAECADEKIELKTVNHS